MTKYRFYCPRRGTEGTFDAPALEVCPECHSLKGSGPGRCNFIILPESSPSDVKIGRFVKLPSSTDGFNIGNAIKTFGTEEVMVV